MCESGDHILNLAYSLLVTSPFLGQCTRYCPTNPWIRVALYLDAMVMGRSIGACRAVSKHVDSFPCKCSLNYHLCLNLSGKSRNEVKIFILLPTEVYWVWGIEISHGKRWGGGGNDSWCPPPVWILSYLSFLFSFFSSRNIFIQNKCN